jgi:cell wall-associated NlpC family hydrolase
VLPSSGFGTATVDGNAVAAAARRAIQSRADYRYEQRRPMPNSLFGPPLPIVVDCSAFATLAYKAAQAPDPNGLGYNGGGDTATLWANGMLTTSPQPGDLVFYGSPPKPHHVAVYLGDGRIANMGRPGEPIEERVDAPGPPLGYRTYNAVETPAESAHHRDGRQ